MWPSEQVLVNTNMETVTDLSNVLSLEFAALMMPWITILSSLVLAALVRDWVTSFVKGIKFKLWPNFNPGDKVILDDEEAVIVSIGMMTTVFSKIESEGIVWRYVPNERIPYLKLERVIQENVKKTKGE